LSFGWQKIISIMQKQMISKYYRAGYKFILGILIFWNIGVHAQTGKAEIAKCAELKDESIQQPSKLCTAHTGCRYVLHAQKNCATAKQYLNRLKSVMLMDIILTEEKIPVAAPLMGDLSKSKVTIDNIFEAAKTDNTKRLDALLETKKLATGLRDGVRQAPADELIHKDGSVYYGTIKNGKPNGIGTRIHVTGKICRGTFRDGLVVDDESMDCIEENGRSTYSRYVNGQGAIVNNTGVVWVGNYSRERITSGRLYAEDDRILAEGDWDSNGFTGKIFDANGNVMSEGKFDINGTPIGR
jgi:hypothetical protein